MLKNLQSIQEHIKNAPSSYLSRLRTKFTKKSGLVQNSKIHGELCDEILNEERLLLWLQKRNEAETQILGLIYASGSRGLHFRELERNFEIDQKSLAIFLSESANELFIWYAKCQNSYVYYGFSNFEEIILNSSFKNSETAELAWVSNEKKAELHLLFMLAKIQLGKISVKKDLSLNQHTKKSIAEIFANNKNFDHTTTEEYIRLLLSFLISEKWLSKPAEANELKLLPGSYDFLRNNGFRFFSEFIFWWEGCRFKHKGDLTKLLKFFTKPVEALTAAQMFWPHDAGSRMIKNKNSTNWAHLPCVLKELWFLGILKLQAKKRHILTFSLTEFGESVFFAKKLKENLEPIIASSSNFEWLLSQSCGAMKIFQMSVFAQPKNEEDPLRFAFSKESFLAGLRSGIPEDFVKDFMQWNRAVPNVAKVLKEWHCIYSDSSIEILRILRIKNPDKFAELARCKPFLALAEEVIPNWGFVIAAENETKIRDILSNFSLEPHFLELDKNKEEPLRNLAETENFKLPRPTAESGDVLMSPSQPRYPQ